ncbi:3680_t:CDS:2, partial [Dentiscutata erythropus]
LTENNIGEKKSKRSSLRLITARKLIANSISKFTNEELQKVIDNFPSNYVNSTEISTTSGLQNHVPEAKANVPTTSNSEDKISEEISRSEDAIASKSLSKTEH